MSQNDPTAYETASGEPLPDKVLEVVAPAEEWDAEHTRPDNVLTPVLPGEIKVYHVVNQDGEEEFVSQRGGTYGEADRHYRVGRDPEWHIEYTRNPDITHYHPDTKAEHVTKVIVAMPCGNQFKLYSRSDLLWNYGAAAPDVLGAEDVSEDILRLAENLSDVGASHKPDRPDGWEHVSGGWHSSMERSQLSDKINGITSGEAHDALGWNFPVVVKFGDTNNVCSVNMDVYAPTAHVQTVKEELSGTRAKPGHAGLAD